MAKSKHYLSAVRVIVTAKSEDQAREKLIQIRAAIESLGYTVQHIQTPYTTKLTEE